MKIQILIDNPNSWMIPYVRNFSKKIHADFIQNHDEISDGDILILLSCEKKLEKRSLNSYNLVVHESDLPLGKGWSPLTWQILEGREEIVVSLIEAEDKIDSGVIYEQSNVRFEGHELVDELRAMQADVTFLLIEKFLKKYPNNIKGVEQKGEQSFYKRRNPEHSKLDIEKSIEEQFNLLRVCDNERYPAFFEKDGIKYFLRIDKDA